MHESFRPKKERVLTTKITALSPLGERGNRKAVGEGVEYGERSA
jgi:hypothetical protein